LYKEEEAVAAARTLLEATEQDPRIYPSAPLDEHEEEPPSSLLAFLLGTSQP
jgi:hypothetical protein